MAARREEPEVVQVARLVSGPIQERHRLLDRHLVPGVNPDLGILGQIAVLLVPAQDRAFRQRQDDALVEGDVDLDGLPARRGERAFIGEVERAAVLVGMTVEVVGANLWPPTSRCRRSRRSNPGRHSGALRLLGGDHPLRRTPGILLVARDPPDRTRRGHSYRDPHQAGEVAPVMSGAEFTRPARPAPIQTGRRSRAAGLPSRARRSPEPTPDRGSRRRTGRVP